MIFVVLKKEEDAKLPNIDSKLVPTRGSYCLGKECCVSFDYDLIHDDQCMDILFCKIWDNFAKNSRDFLNCNFWVVRGAYFRSVLEFAEG